ncbi:MAG: non-canonical purine NTP pyrophosphatase [Caldisericia bacterium]|nr:non-canonical purine NTP pyrophosphatase [Caldisericia bacterium]MDD4615054.1 non-canonical purine NTP pyrophosphatase [Caldisericia bacterium]
MQIILASANRHKLQEIQEKIGFLSIPIQLSSDIGCTIDSSVEQFTTYHENAKAKCDAVLQQLPSSNNFICMADDAGIEVPVLGNIPGVHSARFASSGKDIDHRTKLLQMLRGFEFSQKHCHFTCVLCCWIQNQYYFFEGRVDGFILGFERGEHGFGYDPLFYYPPYQKTFAEISSEKKNQVSHRGRALEKFGMFLEKYQRWDSNPHEV